MLRKKTLHNRLQDSNILKEETANVNSLLFGVILVSS